MMEVLLVVATGTFTLLGALASAIGQGLVESGRAKARGRAALVQLLVEIARAQGSVHSLQRRRENQIASDDLPRFNTFETRPDDLVEVVPADELVGVIAALEAVLQNVERHNALRSEPHNISEPVLNAALDLLNASLENLADRLAARVTLSRSLGWKLVHWPSWRRARSIV